MGRVSNFFVLGDLGPQQLVYNDFMSIEKEFVEQLDNLQRRVQILEHRLMGGMSQPERVDSSPVRPSVARARYQPPAARHRAQALKSEADAVSAGSLLGIVGVICFILAAAFLVKLAISAGWLNPFRQWSLVALLGTVLVGVGLFLQSSDSEYAGRLAASGLVVLYFAAYSAHHVFGLFSQNVALGFTLVASVAGLSLARTFRSDVFSSTAVLGTYLSPLLLGYAQMPFEVLAGYFLIWTTIFSMISTTLDSRKTTILAAYAGVGIYALLNFIDSSLASPSQVVIVQFLQFVILLGGAVRHSVHAEEPLGSDEAMAFLPPLLFFYGTEYYFLSKWVGDAAPWISLGFVVVLLMGYFFARSRLKTRGGELDSFSVVGAFVSVVFFHAGYLEIFPDPAKPYLMLAFIVALIFIPESDNRSLGLWAWPLLTMIVVSLLEYGKIFLDLLQEPVSSRLHLGGMTALLMIVAYLGSGSLRRWRDGSTIFLMAAHSIAILSLYRIAEVHGSFAVSISWAVYSILVLTVAFAKKDWIFAKSSLLVLLLSAGKALIYDVSSASGGVRIVCLLLTGALLYGSGFLFRKIAQNERG